MNTPKRSFTLLLAIATAATAFTSLVPVRAAADPTDLTTICFRSRTILVPLYLLSRYQAVAGTTLGACPPTP